MYFYDCYFSGAVFIFLELLLWIVISAFTLCSMCVFCCYALVLYQLVDGTYVRLYLYSLESLRLPLDICNCSVWHISDEN